MLGRNAFNKYAGGSVSAFFLEREQERFFSMHGHSGTISDAAQVFFASSGVGERQGERWSWRREEAANRRAKQRAPFD